MTDAEFVASMLVLGSIALLAVSFYGLTKGYKYMLPVAVIITALVIALLFTVPPVLP